MNQSYLSRLGIAQRLRARDEEGAVCGAHGSGGAVGACGGHEHKHDHEHEHDHSQAHQHDHGQSCGSAHAAESQSGAGPKGHTHGQACCHDGVPPRSARRAAPAPEGTRRARWRIENMDCPTEERLIRNRLEPMPGVVRLDFDLLARELTVHHQLDDTQPVVAALRALDMAPRELDDNASAQAAPPASIGLALRQKLLLAVSGVAAAGAEVLAWSTGKETSLLVLACAVISILCAGLPTLRKGWIALRNFTINIYFLMSLALIGAVAIGKWPEAAMVVFLFALAEEIEALSLERARQAIRALTALAPETAEVWQAGDGVPERGEWREYAVGEVAVGSRIRVRTGQRVPLDARMVAGRAALDQAPITGESLPVDKETGAALYAGSIVVDGVVEAVVSAAAQDSTLARIAAAVQEAQAQRAPTQRFVDQFARYYTPAVVVLAVVIALAGPLVFGGAWSAWLYKALVLLVIACPCALVVSTPVTIVSGLAAAARHGMLVKGGVWLERGRLLKAVALDKTGTLTRGEPVLTDALAAPVRALVTAEASGEARLSTEEALRIAASLDDASTHPVARAVVEGWRARAPDARLLAVDQFAVLNGRGVQGRIDGALWSLGNHRLVEELGLCSPELEAQLATLEHAGKTAIVLCAPQEAVAVFAVADALRAESAPAVQALRALGVTPVMLTGDNVSTARAIADQLGIDDARGNLMPQDKQDAIAALSQQYGMAAMVGDGVNDAPALARADIGFAMGAAGTATALETADVAIMDDDPRKIAAFIGLSRKTAAVLTQNIALALGIKAVFLVLAMAGEATLWMAVFADVGASLLVVANGLRVRRHFDATRNMTKPSALTAQRN
ncbi:putative cadmium-transporting ATPase [Paraburkholderia hiiakae]|uniref:P-type Zn(2+) transporter n=1 Tax=Paraburkholderia hiiakae TaxID=1081782 RepID=A0ABM8P343_9BURK|nr:heavy metal translocating P-type ATPase [Paraburkholderia hiiakae]CAD6555062.1 putative cadmium-transporting ATPase [Paraburkholderia hiiakae]